jgi:hypothetical protein
MRKLIVALILISTIPVFGQNHIIGLKGGVSLTNIHSSNFLSKVDNLTGFNGGLSYEYRFENHFNLGIDFLYFQKGFTNDIIFTDDYGIPTGEKATSYFKYDYLSLPVKGGFFIGDKISGFLNIGLVPSILINAKTTAPGIIGSDYEETNEVTDIVKKLDFGGLIEIGGSYKFGDKFLIFTSFAYQQSFMSITNTDYFSSSSIKHYGMTMSIGLKYIL